MDSKLILRAQLHAGSNIHDLNGLMNAYAVWDRLASRGMVGAVGTVADIERMLRRFVATGKIDRVACNAHYALGPQGTAIS
jgi:hypothetical protein